MLSRPACRNSHEVDNKIHHAGNGVRVMRVLFACRSSRKIRPNQCGEDENQKESQTDCSEDHRSEPYGNEERCFGAAHAAKLDPNASAVGRRPHTRRRPPSPGG